VHVSAAWRVAAWRQKRASFATVAVHLHYATFSGGCCCGIAATPLLRCASLLAAQRGVGGRNNRRNKDGVVCASLAAASDERRGIVYVWLGVMLGGISGMAIVGAWATASWREWRRPGWASSAYRRSRHGRVGSSLDA